MNKKQITDLTASFKERQVIDDFIITEDEKGYMVNVLGNVRLYGMELTKIPLRFGEVNGDFLLYNNQLTTLEGSPTIVNGVMDCFNNRIDSLEHAPIYIGGHFLCQGNLLINLEYSPLSVGGYISFKQNLLRDVRGCTKRLSGNDNGINLGENSSLDVHHIHHLFELGYDAKTVRIPRRNVASIYRKWVIENIIK